MTHNVAEALLAIAILLALYWWFPRPQTGVAPTPVAPAQRPVYQPGIVVFVIIVAIALWIL